MAIFTGANVENITKVKQSDVFTKVDQTVVGMVTVPQAMIDADGAMPLATLLTSTDGGLTWSALTTPAFEVDSYAVDDEVYYEGHIWKSTAPTNTTTPGNGDWTDLGEWNANGVLYNDLTESKKTTVLVTGTVKEKYLVGNDSFLRVTLFNNKIIAK